MLRLAVAALAVSLIVLPSASFARGTASPTRLAGLDGPVSVVRDKVGVPHVYAKSERDAYFMVGWLHAQDRLFQMDSTRRQASGTLAELLGPSSIPSDVQLRTLGLRRAAELSLAAYSPAVRKILAAYSAGVNAYVKSHPLPPEYAAVEVTKFTPWTELDTAAVTKLLAFGLSFDVSDIANTQKLVAYQTALGQAPGTTLFSQDVMRSEPFVRAPSIENGEKSTRVVTRRTLAWSTSFLDKAALGPATTRLLRRASAAGIATEPATDTGSNVWVVAPSKSASGNAMVASDPHLSLPSPSTFYEIGIDVSGANGTKLYGVTFPGTPSVVHGMNEHVAWGSTVNPTDVTDVYQEQVVMAGLVPGATIYNGAQEPTQVIFQEYKANQVGNGTKDDLVTVPASADVPPVTVIVPRHGPIVSLTPPTALTVQFTGFYATREPDYFLELAHARNVTDAKRALRFFDFGAQNWMFADDSGNIAYFTNREIPLREDLQAGKVVGLPPYFIRNGTGGNEWIPQATRPADQAIPFAILPDAEQDQLVNPERGWISNANQDPTGQTWDNDPLNELRPGGGIRYISPGHADGNRNWRIRERLRNALSDGKISFAEMQAVQSDVKLHDPSVFVPLIVEALQDARTPTAPAALAAFAADTRVVDAVGRLERWDFTTPTGLAEGYDWTDVGGKRAAPSQEEIDASVAATIYSLWRGQALALIVDAPLVARGLGSYVPNPDQAMTAMRHLVLTPNGGASGIFVKGDMALDTLMLTALKNALDLAASPAFAPAFGGSTNLVDYRWGRLHRITFKNPLGAAFSIPGTGHGFTDLGTTLPGVATDGGFSAVDASSHNPRAKTVDGFTFASGPARRFVAEARKGGPRAVQVIPGGESGNPSGRFFGNQLGLWLTDDYHAATVGRVAGTRQEFVPAR